MAHACICQSYEDGFQARGNVLINYTADKYAPPSADIGDPEKYYWPKAIARFKKYGVNDSIANRYIELFKNNSPFHFTLIGMARIASLYSQAPSMQRNNLQYLREVFKRKDSFNAWTGEGTENHVGMSRTSGYLFAQYALHHDEFKEEAKERLRQMDEWIKTTAKRNYEVGTGEWNSSTYGAYNIIGWLNLYDFATDSSIRLIARAALDYYACELSLHYSYGAIGGSEMRGGNSSLHTATSYLGWLWFGEMHDAYAKEGVLKGSQAIQCVHAVTSKYRPPLIAVDIARKNVKMPEQYVGSQPSYLLDKRSFIKETFYLGKGFTLGSTVSPYGGYTGSTAQVIAWKLVVEKERGKLPAEISGNGMFYDGMPLNGRDPYTQVVQHKNVLIQMTSVPRDVNERFKQVEKIIKQWQLDWRSDFDKRFPDDPYKKKNMVTLRENIKIVNQSFLHLPLDVVIDSSKQDMWGYIGNAFLRVRSLKRKLPRMVLQDGRCYLIDEAPLGEMCGFMLEIGDKSEYTNLKEFKASLAKSRVETKRSHSVKYVSLSGDVVQAQFATSGYFTEATSDWGYGKTTPSVMITSPPLRQPEWPQGEGWGKVPVLSVNDKRVNAYEPWPIWQGPQLTLDNRVLVLRNDQALYSVDFSSSIPVFSERPTQEKP
jgi:hypothetical protein